MESWLTKACEVLERWSHNDRVFHREDIAQAIRDAGGEQDSNEEVRAVYSTLILRGRFVPADPRYVHNPRWGEFSLQAVERERPLPIEEAVRQAVARTGARVEQDLRMRDPYLDGGYHGMSRSKYTTQTFLRFPNGRLVAVENDRPETVYQAVLDWEHEQLQRQR